MFLHGFVGGKRGKVFERGAYGPAECTSVWNEALVQVKSVKLHEVRMEEKCNIALREADFQVKSVKPPAVRTKGNHKDQEVP